MPYPMVHLLPANQMMGQVADIRDRGAFLLGTIAPDAVHFRQPYTPEHKRRSHFSLEGVAWVDPKVDYHAWEAHALQRLMETEWEAPFDFVRGYATHILVDVFRGQEIWTPMMGGLTGSEAQETEGRWRADCIEHESCLCAEVQGDAPLWRAFESARPCGMQGCISVEELAKTQRSIIEEQYVDRVPDPSHRFTCLTLEQLRGFMNQASLHITRKIKTCLL